MKNVNTIKIRKSGKTIKTRFFDKIFFLTMLLLNIKNSNCQNSTTCYEMYSNNTIKQNCFNSTACCYLQYTFQEKKFNKCIEKINVTENICPGVNDVSYKEGVNMEFCDCSQIFISLNFLIFLIIIVNIV